MRRWSITIILSSIILPVLQDLTNFVVTYTLKDRRIA
jgi:hypothetical protein